MGGGGGGAKNAIVGRNRHTKGIDGRKIGVGGGGGGGVVSIKT